MATITEISESGGRSIGLDSSHTLKTDRQFTIHTSGLDDPWDVLKALLLATHTTDDPPVPMAKDPVTGDIVPLGIGMRYYHPTDLLALFIRSIDLEATADDEDGRTWQVSVQYGPWEPRESNPLDEEPAEEWGNDTRTEVVDNDAEGVPILNSASDPFDPPVTRDRHTSVLTVTRNEESYPFLARIYYQDSVNEFAWKGAAARTVLCESVTAREAWDQNVPTNGGWYWIVTYTFLHKPEGWYARPLDAGFREKFMISADDPGDREADPPIPPTNPVYERRRILVEGADATSPVPLNGWGEVLDPNEPAVIGQYLLYPELDYKYLRLDGEAYETPPWELP